MSLRFCYLALVAVTLATEAGCCCCCDDCWPNGKTWCGPHCGQFWWHEWFSHPPECCDPCDDCGNYCGPTHSSGYPGYGPGNPPTNGMDYAPAESSAGEYSPELADPLPAEELPPGEPSAAAF